MTGFIRSDHVYDENENNFQWQWQIRSVNNKNLEIKSRIPSRFDHLEPILRKKIQNNFTRGSFSVSLTYQKSEEEIAYIIDDKALDNAINALQDIENKAGPLQAYSASDVICIPGVWIAQSPKINEHASEELDAILQASFDESITQLKEIRAQEGSAIYAVLTDMLNAMMTYTQNIKDNISSNLNDIRVKLTEQVQALSEDEKLQLNPERLDQEVLILISKADIREEVDRLTVHFNNAQELINGDKPVGRRLDFLCQELNREANTICSKSKSIDITQNGMDLKVTIEQFREQIQNIE